MARFRLLSARALALSTLFACAVLPLRSQAKPAPVDREVSGDSPADPGPLAGGLSTKLDRSDIESAMRLVANWQVSTARNNFNQQWTYAALYDGLLAASRATGDPKYADAVEQVANDRFHWRLLNQRFPHADDEALGQAYLDLYRRDPQPVRLADTRSVMDALIVRPDDPEKPVWWWCDALFMAPPVLARMYTITRNHKYLDYMDHEWWITSGLLYDADEHLFFRDAHYLQQKEKNGQPIFWARGNGWVLAGLANVLEAMPANYPIRSKFISQFRAMSARIAGVQQSDGLWKTGLLDPGAYTSSEVSGSAFFTFAMAWGINHGLLDAKVFRPVVERAWAGMLHHIYADGRLGSIQPIGAAPDTFAPSSSYVYGVGGFLLAGSELDRLAQQPKTRSRDR